MMLETGNVPEWESPKLSELSWTQKGGEVNFHPFKSCATPLPVAAEIHLRSTLYTHY